MSARCGACCAVVLLLAPIACQPRATHPGRTIGLENYPGARDLYRLAEAYRAKHRLPALGIGIAHEGRIVGLGVAGERAAGSADWATVDDAFDVASCAKSVTATVAALLVERAQARWNVTVAEVFPELRSVMDPGYAGVTLEMLLRHRAGLNHDMNRNDRWAGWQEQYANASPTEQRLAFTRTALQKAPRSIPGSDTFYSSDSYLVAGSMLERLSGQGWEQLVRTLLFEPLDLRSMRYGVPAQVFGHDVGRWGRLLVVPPGKSGFGVRPFGAPAGFLQANVPDLLRYVSFHISGERGSNELLPRGAFEHLHHSDNGERYALGWESEVRRDGKGRVIEHSVHHSGYSGRFRANLWFVPETQWGTAIVMNSGRGDDAVTGDIFYGLIGEFGLSSRSTSRAGAVACVRNC